MPSRLGLHRPHSQRGSPGRTNHGAAHRANRIARRSLGTGGPGRLEFIRYPALIWHVRINPARSGWKPAGLNEPHGRHELDEALADKQAIALHQITSDTTVRLRVQPCLNTAAPRSAPCGGATSGMHTYRCCFLDHHERISADESIKADAPTDAIDRARAMLCARPHHRAGRGLQRRAPPYLSAIEHASDPPARSASQERAN